MGQNKAQPATDCVADNLTMYSKGRKEERKPTVRLHSQEANTFGRDACLCEIAGILVKF